MTTLLAVDDEIAINLIIQTYFDDKYSVISMPNGREAINWLEKGGAADVIIVDLNMPEMDGLEFIKTLKSSDDFSHIPLIVLSSEESSAKKVECLKKGADDYLVKPFNPEELEVRIEKLINLVKK